MEPFWVIFKANKALFLCILPQNALRRDFNGKCIELIEAHYLEVVVEVYIYNVNNLIIFITALPAKSDTDFMFCLQSYQGLIIDRSHMY